MSGKKYRDLDSGKVVTLTADQAARVAGLKSSKFAGDRYKPLDGVSEVAVTDSTGQIHLHNMDAQAASFAVSTGNQAIMPVGDSNREAIKQLSAEQAEERAWRQMASDQALETFVGNFVPGIRALDRIGMTEEQQAHDVMMTEYQDQENPFAAITGKVGSAIALSLVPVPGLGAASGLFRGAKASRSAMSLFGFADEAGEALALGLAARGVPKIAAKYAGTIGAGAVMNIPLSVQFQAAQAVDYDRPLTYEAFARNLGTHVMMGAAFDALLPFAKGAWVGYKAFSPVTRGVGMIAKAPGVRNLPGAQKVASYVSRKLQANTARRMAGGSGLDEAAARSAAYSKSLDEIFPSKLKTNASGAPQVASLKRIAKSLDEIAAQSPQIAAKPEFMTARRGLESLAGMEKAIGTATGKAGTASDALLGYLRAPKGLPKGSVPSGRSRLLELPGAAERLRQELTLMGKGTQIGDELEAVLKSATHDRQGVQLMMAFRNRKLAEGLKGTPEQMVQAQVAKKHIDSVLSTFGDDLKVVLQETDEIFAGVQALRGATLKMRDLNKHTNAKDFGAGEMSANVKRVQQNMESLGNKGVIDGDDLAFAGAHLEGAETLIEGLAGRLEVAAAMNTIRGAASNEFKALTHTPLKASPETATFGMFEAAAQYFNDGGNIIVEAIRAASTGEVRRGISRSPMTTGVWQYRSMGSMDDKRAAYDDIRERVLQLTATDDTLIQGVERLTTGMQSEPELANAVATQVVKTAQYIKQHLPSGPQGTIDYRRFNPSPAEVSKVLEIAGALDDPLSVMDAYLRGAGRAAGLHAVEAVYPMMLSDMRVQVAQHFLADPEVYAGLPYRVRLDVDAFVGGGFEPSAQPRALVNFQNRAAQTQAQDQALRGNSLGKRPEPGSDSASDRLAAF